MTSKISLHRLSSKQQFGLFVEDFIKGARALLRKNSSTGQSVENFIRITYEIVDKPHGFVLFVIQDMKLKGFLVANCIEDPGHSWIECIGIWTAPGIGRKVKYKVMEEFRKWAMTIDAKEIIAGMIRCRLGKECTQCGAPDDFFWKWFYKDLGFEKIGYVMRAKV